MKKIVGYLKDYIANTDKRVALLTVLFTAALVFCNYFFGLNRLISRLPYGIQFLSWFVVFFVAFFIGYRLQVVFKKTDLFAHKKFLLLLVIAPAIFAWKMMFPVHLHLFTDVFRNQYWNAVIYWPFKVIVITLLLLAVHRFFDGAEPFYCVTTKSFSVTPYLIMLMLMVPLVALASSQPDFLRMYPRMQHIAYLFQPDKGWHKLLYELSYGSDFFAIELFFRGFLIFAFAKYAGKDTILPMAIFYCTIHFGKPLGECISSFFGGIILGVVSYHTRTILGGILVHVGLAWMMELGGHLSNNPPPP